MQASQTVVRPQIAPLPNLKAYQLLFQIENYSQLNNTFIRKIKEKICNMEEITESEYVILLEVWKEAIFLEQKRAPRGSKVTY